MVLLRNLLSLFVLAARRLLNNAGLMIGTAVAVIVAVALTVSIPVYANGVSYRLLTDALAQSSEAQSRPPFAFRFRYADTRRAPADPAAYRQADAFFAGECQRIIDLPVQVSTHLAQTYDMRLSPTGATAAAYGSDATLFWVSLGFVDQLGNHVTLLEGELPTPQAAGDTGPVQVLVSAEKANETGLAVGEEFLLKNDSDSTEARIEIPVRVVGIWQANDVDDPFWFYEPVHGFDTMLLTDEQSWQNVVAPAFKKPVTQAIWYQVYDGHGVQTEQVSGFLQRVTTVQARVASLFPQVKLDISPVDVLVAYVQAARSLMVLLYVFAIPIVGLILYFVVLTSGMAVRRQRNEIATLRSRGTSVVQVVALYLIEGLFLGLLGIGLGLVLGKQVASAMGRALSFLQFTGGPSQVVARLSRPAIGLGVSAAVVCLVASLVPALRAAQRTIVTYKQEVARAQERPWWQRTGLDLVLLAVPLYGYYLLRQQGAVALPGEVAGGGGGPFSNPLLFLTPTLFVFALALVFVRVFPAVVALLARCVEPLRGVPLLLALRQLARSWQQYTGPLLLITLTLGMACFTASMAGTLDRDLVDRTYYETGADLRWVETGDRRIVESALEKASAKEGPLVDTSSLPTYWSFTPVSEHLGLPGVVAAARLGSYSATMDVGGSTATGTILGVDRADFEAAAYFRRDFAGVSLRTLMNTLARVDDGVLVQSSVLSAYGLSIGDSIKMHVKAGDATQEVPFTIAGAVDLFPTVYPNYGAFWICNLDYLFDYLGGEYPYDVLLRTEPGADTGQMAFNAPDLNIYVSGAYDSREAIANERQRPARQGILGLLSVAYLAAALLTVLGFLFHSFVSFRQRFVELGILRAIGLSTGQMAAFLGLEQAALIGVGVAAGTGFGILASRLFIPFLQIGTGSKPQVPPFSVQIAWGNMLQVYAVFGVMLVFAIAGLVYLLARMRIAQAVKIGEIS